MDAVVVHHDPCAGGGGERVFLNVVEALHEMGFAVDVITVDRYRPGCLEKLYGRDVTHIVRSFHSIGFELGGFGLYKRLLSLIPYYIYAGGHDLVFNTHGDLIPLYGASSAPPIQYIHFPTMALQLRDRYPSKYVSGFWRIYYEPYSVLTQQAVKLAVGKSLVLTNSQYSREAIRAVLGVDAVVIPPPVDVERFRRCGGGKEENLVVDLGRLSQDKRHEITISVAKHMPEARFIIAGSSRPSDRRYIEHLKRIAPKNVEIEENIPLEKLVEILCRAKALLHPMPGEHFGIAIVEAMAAGAIPVTWDLGGPREFVPAKYRFRNLADAIEKLRQALRAPEDEGEAMKRIASRYSEKSFRERVKLVVRKAIQNS